jgi:predicted ABC-class ATPase
VADTVIAMREYRAADLTVEARALVAELPTGRRAEVEPWRPLRPRRPVPASLEAARGSRDVLLRVLARDRLQFGRHLLDLGALEQLVEVAQTRAIGHALEWARHGAVDGARTVAEAVAAILRAVEEGGLDVVQPYPTGELAAFRPLELAAALNRLRTLRTEPAR